MCGCVKAKESGRGSFRMINIGIIYLKWCSRHTGQKRVRKWGAKEGARQRWEYRAWGRNVLGATATMAAEGSSTAAILLPLVERCEVLHASHWLPVSLDPPSGGKQPITGGYFPLTDGDCQGGVRLTTQPAILCGVGRAARLPSHGPISSPLAPPRASGSPQHRPLSPEGPCPPQKVPLPLRELEDPRGT